MSLELVNTLATFGTFVVIAATAIAAIVQLRHARSSNQIVALNELREMMEAPEFVAAFEFISTELSSKLQDSSFRHQWNDRSARTDEGKRPIGKIRTIMNYYEGMGVLVKTGLVDRELALDMWSEVIIVAWDNLAPFTVMGRRRQRDLCENFEYLTVLAQDFLAAHPKGTYPSGVRRIDLKDEWLEADKQYAVSLAPA
ncbi:MAG: DUF4760 domain-containing protein [Candidatus Eremiobacteraeota bacterium]|nr:DUF4760 domain-containing protein [Candidatus Eremiobacteraeota bacterium]